MRESPHDKNAEPCFGFFMTKRKGIIWYRDVAARVLKPRPNTRATSAGGCDCDCARDCARARED